MTGPTAVRGSHALLVTPFDDHGDVDHASLAGLVEFVLAGRVDGVVALGTTGEFFALTPTERADVMAFVARQVGRRATLTFGVADSSTRTSIDLARHAEELGADCVMLPAPYYFKHSEAAVDAHFRTVAAAVGIPLMIYDGGAGIELSVEQMRRLHQSEPGIAYVKLSVPVPDKVRSVGQHVPGLLPLCGDDSMMILALQLGAVGSTVGSGNIQPDVLSEVHRLYEAGDVDKARQVHTDKLLPAANVCCTSKSEYIRCYKEVLKELGVISSPATRPPLQPLEPIRREELIAVMRRVSVL